MSHHPDDIKQPLDHLPPREERDKAIEIEEPHYPGADDPSGSSAVSPATAAEPDAPGRHGLAKPSTSGA